MDAPVAKLHDALAIQLPSNSQFPVHSTLLGKRSGHIVVACKNFLNKEKGEQLIEAKLIMKNINESPDIYESNKHKGIHIEDCEEMIKKHPLFENIRKEAIQRLWDMFIIDAYIGNPDRNNGNWGVIKDKDDNVRLAPIYDNGNSLNEKWGPLKMAQLEKGTEKEKLHLVMQTPCVYIDSKGEKITPCSAIKHNSLGKECEKAILRNVPKIKKAEAQINQMIDDTPGLLDSQKIFYKTILHERLDKVLLPAYEKLRAKEKSYTR